MSLELETAVPEIANELNASEILAELARLQEELRATKAQLETRTPASRSREYAFGPPSTGTRTANSGSAKYEILDPESGNRAGKIPAQQDAIIQLLAPYSGQTIPESGILQILEEGSEKYPVLASSVQGVKKVWDFYKNLAPKGNHAGLVYRGFIRKA